MKWKSNNYRGIVAEISYCYVCSRSDSSGEIEAVQTSKRTLYSRKAVVIAAGCWTGALMHDLFKNSDIDLDIPVKPRKVRTYDEIFFMFKCLRFVDYL